MISHKVSSFLNSSSLELEMLEINVYGDKKLSFLIGANTTKVHRERKIEPYFSYLKMLGYC